MKTLVFDNRWPIETETEEGLVKALQSPSLWSATAPREEIGLAKPVAIDDRIETTPTKVGYQRRDASKGSPPRSIAHSKSVDRDDFVNRRTHSGKRRPSSIRQERNMTSGHSRLEQRQRREQEYDVSKPAQPDGEDLHGTIRRPDPGEGGGTSNIALSQSRYCRLLGRPLEFAATDRNKKSRTSSTSDTRNVRCCESVGDIMLSRIAFNVRNIAILAGPSGRLS